MQTYRIVSVLVAIVLGFFALQLGDGIHHLTALDTVKPRQDQNAWALWSVMIGIAMTMLFFGLFSMAVQFSDDQAKLVGTAVATMALGFYFGLIVGPVSEWGPYPWYWFQSKWAILLVLALLPPIYLLVEFGREISIRRRASRESNVTPINRSSSNK